MGVDRLTSRDWMAIFASVVLLYNAASGIKTGRAMVVFQYVKRSEDALLFWIVVWGSALLGVACGIAVVLHP